MAKWDIRRRGATGVIPSASTEEALRQILTDEQVDGLKTGQVPGVVEGTSIAYNQTHTQGFYHLRNQVSKRSNPFATYLFTGDGAVMNSDVDTTPSGEDFYL